MHAFLTDTERKEVLSHKFPVVNTFLEALESRVKERVKWGGLLSSHSTTQWYYPAAEYLSDAAMLHQFKPSNKLAGWIRSVTMDIIRRPVSEWVGPLFRDHSEPFTGHLETAHICWGIASVLDLAEDLFTNAEIAEIRTALHDKGILLCRRWLQKNTHLANWRGIMCSGGLVASSVLDDEDLVNAFTNDIVIMAEAFQPDGSYGESLQYGNYLANALMIAYESLIRKYPEQASRINIASYSKGMEWMAQSMLYTKPLGGLWGEEARARAVNFNDSAAIFRPSGDLLMHVASRFKDEKQASLARWMFKIFYEPVPDQGPHDLASFGMRNDWGFLTIPLLTQAPRSASPQKLQLALTASFSNGNVMVRDKWKGNNVLAIQAGNNDGCFAPGHLQGDLNSFMLSYKNERLLADAGHSCYRNIIHGLESATHTHNTCTFLMDHDQLGLQEDLAKIKLLEQKNVLARRLIKNNQPGKPIDRGGRLLHCERVDNISLIASEVAGSYGDPVKEFTRLWLQIDANITLVIDRIRASSPVKTVWNFLLNNRDLATKVITDQNSVTASRHKSAVKIIHAGEAALSGPVYAYMHDAYHVEPNNLGEGHSGSGLLYRFTDKNYSELISCLHIIIADDAGSIGKWKIASGKTEWRLSAGSRPSFILNQSAEDPFNFSFRFGNESYGVYETNHQFKLTHER